MDLEKARKELQERAKRQKEEGRERKFYTLPSKGRAVVRYLEQADGNLGMITGGHFNIPGVDRGICTCPKEHWDLPCLIHQVLQRFEKLLNVDEFKVNSYGYCAVLVLEDTENPSMVDPKTPKIMRQTEFGYKQILEWVLSKAVGDITNPRTGAPVAYERKDKKDKWSRTIYRESSPIAATEAEIQEILKKVPDLSKAIKRPSDADMQKVQKGAEALYDLLEKKMEQAKIDDAAKLAGQVPPAEKAKPSEAKPPEIPATAEKPSAPPVEKELPKPVVSSGAVTSPVEKKAEPVPAAPTPTPPAAQEINRPANAPQCFADPSVNNPKDRRCIMCTHEFYCRSAIDLAKKA